MRATNEIGTSRLPTIDYKDLRGLTVDLEVGASVSQVSATLDGIIAGDVTYANIPPIPTPPAEPTVTSSGTTYYVDQDIGSDGNAGTSAGAPLATIDAGLSKLSTSGGDTLIISQASGNYSSDQLRVPTINGSSGAWTTIKGADGQTVAITGNDGDNLTIGYYGNSSYIYIKNLKIEGRTNTDCIRIRGGSHHIFVDDCECDGNNASSSGMRIGNYVSTGPPAGTPAYDLYIKNVYAHHFTFTTDSRGFHVYARCHDIVFIGCHASHAENNFAGHNALPGNVWENVGPPNSESDTMDNIWCINCLSHDSGEGGFDWANCLTEYYYNCKSYGDSEGIKTWARETWIVNCELYEHTGPGIAIKPNFNNTKYYFLNNTLVNNNSSGEMVGQIRIPADNGGHTLFTANLYLYNNIMQTSKNIFGFDGANWNFAQCDNNYHHGAADSTWFYQQYNRPANWNLVGQQSFTWAKSNISNLTGDDANSVIKTGSDGVTNPGFTNAGADDYTLTASSLALAAGENIDGLNDDYSGNPRPVENPDMGAHERA